MPTLLLLLPRKLKTDKKNKAKTDLTGEETLPNVESDSCPLPLKCPSVPSAFLYFFFTLVVARLPYNGETNDSIIKFLQMLLSRDNLFTQEPLFGTSWD